jgi:hypothetical protein
VIRARLDLRSQAACALLVLLTCPGCYVGIQQNRVVNGRVDQTFELDEASRIAFAKEGGLLVASVYLKPGSTLQFTGDSAEVYCNGRPKPPVLLRYHQIVHEHGMDEWPKAEAVFRPVPDGHHEISVPVFPCNANSADTRIVWPAMLYSGRPMPGVEIAYRVDSDSDLVVEDLR